MPPMKRSKATEAPAGAEPSDSDDIRAQLKGLHLQVTSIKNTLEEMQKATSIKTTLEEMQADVRHICREIEKSVDFAPVTDNAGEHHKLQTAKLDCLIGNLRKLFEHLNRDE